MDGPSLITWKYQKRWPESPLEQYGGRRGQRDSERAGLNLALLALKKKKGGHESGNEGVMSLLGWPKSPYGVLP